MQAAAFDETRKVLVMFGGLSDAGELQDLWEWNPASGAWTQRPPIGDQPKPRGGASLVFDSIHNNFVIFGGRVGSGGQYLDYADLWEWNPTAGSFTDRPASGQGPGSRSQQSMVFEKSTGKVLLFGGGTPYANAQDDQWGGVSVAFADTWEWDPVQVQWTQLQPATAPSARYAAALVWDSQRSRAVLFGGMEKPLAGLSGVPKQDIWEWDPSKSNWSNRTIPGNRPSARYGHVMAYDPGSGVTVLVGGFDIDTGYALADVWQWDPISGAWSQRLTGSEPNLPTARIYASLVTDSARDRLDLVGGGSYGSSSLPDGEIWEFNPATTTFTDRTPQVTQPWPAPRSNPAVAFCPNTGKTYVFGGMDPNSAFLDDLWEWDGSSWTQVQSDVRPAARTDTAMAYDPARKSLIVYGGTGNPPVGGDADVILGDTWEWNTSTRKWGQLFPKSSPEPRYRHAMVSDSGRSKLLLFGGERPTFDYTYPTPGSPLSVDPFSTAVWEWDGTTTTWTNRTPASLVVVPYGRDYPALSFDDSRQEMVLIADSTEDPISGYSFFWDWDPVAAGWALRDTGDPADSQYDLGAGAVAYDNLRRRHIVPIGGVSGPSPDGTIQTWELDGKTPTWYMRALSGPDQTISQMSAAFDSRRGVLVLFGGTVWWTTTNDTWEYKVTNLGNGEGCTSATASSCASGFCVDGVCCAVASCSGACQSCSVAGKEGTCVRAAPGTEVPGSCAGTQACDGSGKCKTKNGTACSSASVCASGFCVDGVCCESACDGACVSCNQTGRAGKCTAYTIGSDPESECGAGSDPCRMVCNGAGACDAPQYGIPCGTCAVCDGWGTCAPPDPSVCGGGDAGAGGADGSGGTGIGGSAGAGGSAGGAGGTGGAGGRGGAGGTGGTGGTGGRSGSGGTIVGGVGGRGGAGGSIGGTFGSIGGRAGSSIGGTSGSGGQTVSGGTGGSSGLASSGAVGSGGEGEGGRGDTGGVSGSPDSGGSSSPADAGSPDGRQVSVATDAIDTSRLRRSGCECDLSQSSRGTPGLPFALLGAAFFWRRLRRRQIHSFTLGFGAGASRSDDVPCKGDLRSPAGGLRPPRRHQPRRPARLGGRNAPEGRPQVAPTVVALLLLTTCCETDPGNSPRLESSHLALGTVPATESATWTRIGAPSSPIPNPRYLQAAAFDEDRNVLVMFGGWSGASSDNGFGAASQDIWEWNPATGAWTNRTPAGAKPSPRAGASMVYDSVHKNFVIFGGRSTAGYNYEDTWIWDPVGGTLTDATTTGPSARSQHSMVFEKSTGKVLLFGGGRADAGSAIWPETYFYGDPLQRPPSSGPSPDGTGIVLAFSETWEWDPSAGQWTQLMPTTTPSARYDSALVWDSKRNLAVLFGGMQKDQATTGIPQQDTWDWNPTTKNWSLRATSTTMPSPRWGHAMAYDPARGLVVLAGGKSWETYLGLGEVWDWDPASGNWTQRLTGNESGVPAGRMYASLLTDAAQSRLDLVAGITFSTSLPFGGYQPTASAEVWELEPASAKFTNRSALQNWPSQRWGNAIAFCPATGKTYLFGGQSPNYDLLNDLWEWDGSSWSQVLGDVRPTKRANPAMAYDPSRKSLILFGGMTYPSAPYDEVALDLCDTWEWSSATRAWSQLFPASSPGCLGGAGMVTDAGRAKLLLFGGGSDSNSNAVWEWDGAKTTWTNRTPAPGTVTPLSRGGTEGGPLMAFDDGRQKMFLFEGDSTWQGTTSNSVFWEWDPLSAGWALRDSGDFVDLGTSPFPVVAYDSLRRRMVLPSNVTDVVGSTTAVKTWELDSKGPTWYMRDLATSPTTVSTGPGWYTSNATMAFDSQRGVMVLFGAGPTDGSALSEIWEYQATSLGNGEGCTAATASSCASGFCVDGVCCSTVSCSGVCQSCAVVGNQGTCALAAPGTEVGGSCADGQACAAGGVCKAKNGTACSSASACASGVCVDGVCCDSPCDGTCVPCNQASRVGKCSPYSAGSDPQNECGLGSDLCRSTCNGAGACDYPQAGTPCGPCEVCDGNGACWLDSTPYLCNTGGTGGGGAGGAGGSSIGGAGGAGGVATGGGSIAIGGAGGRGGSGGSIIGGIIVGGAGGHAGSGGSIIGSTVLGGVGGAGSGGSGGHGGSGAAGTIVGGAGGAGGVASGGSGGHASTISGGVDAGGAGGMASGGSGGHAGTIVGGAGGSGDAGGASGSPDAGRDSIPPDAGSPDGHRDARPPDAASTARLGHKGCDCDLGHTPADRPGLPLALLAATLLWRRRRR